MQEFAVTIHQQDETTLARAKSWFVDEEAIVVCVAALEKGERGSLHWQATVRTTWQEQTFRLRLKAAFPELKGKAHVKNSNKYAIAPLKKAFEVNINYCLKEITDIDDVRDTMSIFKGMSKEEAWRIAQSMRAEFAGATDVDAKQRKATWNDMLLSACEDREAESRQEIGEAIMHFYRQKRKTQPNRFKLIELINTIEIMMAAEGSHRENELIRDFVSNAIRNDERW